MLETVSYTLQDLLRERREGAVRAIVRAIGYALARGKSAEQVGQFLFDSYRLAGEFDRRRLLEGQGNGAAFCARHMLTRRGWCEDIQCRSENDGFMVESASMLKDHHDVLSFHGVTRMDAEACMETFWRLSGEEMGLAVTYTIGDDRDWAVVRPLAAAFTGTNSVDVADPTPEALAEHRRNALATGITFSVGFAKHLGDEPEALGRFFYEVWDKRGHYERLREQWGFGNALAYAQYLVRSRQILYGQTEILEDLDGYTVTSRSWATEIPQIMGTFGVLPDDVYRYYEGGGVAACSRLGLQYTDRSDDRYHRVWVRSR